MILRTRQRAESSLGEILGAIDSAQFEQCQSKLWAINAGERPPFRCLDAYGVEPAGFSISADLIEQHRFADAT